MGFTREFMNKVVVLFDAGYSCTTIAENLGISESMVQAIVQKAKESY